MDARVSQWRNVLEAIIATWEHHPDDVVCLSYDSEYGRPRTPDAGENTTLTRRDRETGEITRLPVEVFTNERAQRITDGRSFGYGFDDGWTARAWGRLLP